MKGTIINTVFYDGHCGFCHLNVRFLLAVDHAAIFRFAPLQSKIFSEEFSEAERRILPR